MSGTSNNDSIKTPNEDRRKAGDFDKYFNGQFGVQAVPLSLCQCVTTDAPSKMIVTQVGSGVALTVYDRELMIGGMASILMPQLLLESFPHFENAGARLIGQALKPIEDLIGDMKRRGAGKSRIQTRLIGGALLPGDESDMGTKNYVFVREYITRKGLSILNEDWGGKYVRRVHFFPTTGRTVRLMLKRGSDYDRMREDEKKARA